MFNVNRKMFLILKTWEREGLLMLSWKEPLQLGEPTGNIAQHSALIYLFPPICRYNLYLLATYNQPYPNLFLTSIFIHTEFNAIYFLLFFLTKYEIETN